MSKCKNSILLNIIQQNDTLFVGKREIKRKDDVLELWPNEKGVVNKYAESMKIIRVLFAYMRNILYICIEIQWGDSEERGERFKGSDGDLLGLRK